MSAVRLARLGDLEVASSSVAGQQFDKHSHDEFVIGANLVGVLKAQQLKKARLYVIFGTFVFGAAATPSTDPFSMLALAIPMSLLFLAAEFICHLNDKRKAKRLADELVASS